jgi:hypothetical protein
LREHMTALWFTSDSNPPYVSSWAYGRDAVKTAKQMW